MAGVQGQETGTDNGSVHLDYEAPQGQNDTGDEFEDGEYEDGGEQEEDYALANGFLKNVPEEHRSILAPYVKQWDAGVQRRFQEIHSQYAPYQELGDPEELMQAAELYQVLQNEPERLYQALRQAGIGAEEAEEAVYGDDDEAGGGQFSLPPEFQQRIDRMESALTNIAQQFLSQQQQSQQYQEDEALDSYLNNLRTEFGDFDEEFVLSRMYAGESGEQAVQAWNEKIQEVLNQNGGSQKHLPPVLGGGGSTPIEGQDVRKLPSKEVRNLITQVLTQAKQD